MIRKRIVLAATAAFVFALSARSAQIGSPAPDFHGTDSNGKTESLDQFRGKYVVLEWHNHDCPYTLKHYQSGNMQSLQKEWTAKGVVWFTVISSAPGEQGYVTPSQENACCEDACGADGGVDGSERATGPRVQAEDGFRYVRDRSQREVDLFRCD